MQCHRMERLASSFLPSRTSGRFSLPGGNTECRTHHNTRPRQGTELIRGAIALSHPMSCTTRRTANLFSLESAAGVFASWARLRNLRLEQRTCLDSRKKTATKLLLRAVQMTGEKHYVEGHICPWMWCPPAAEQGGAGPQLISPKKRPSKTARAGTSTLEPFQHIRQVSTYYWYKTRTEYLHVSLRRTGTGGGGRGYGSYRTCAAVTGAAVAPAPALSASG